MKIVLYKRNSLINSSGGAEKVMCSIANHFTETGNDVLFLTRDMREGVPFWKLSNTVVLKKLNVRFSKMRRLSGKIFATIGLIGYAPYFDRDLCVSQKINEELERFKPDIIIATSIVDAKEILYKQNPACPIIVMFHSYPGYFFKNRRNNELYRSILKKVSAVQVLQTSFVENVRAYYDGPITVIGNAVAPADCKKEERLKRIICLSRVEPDKRQLAATEAFCKIAADFPDWTMDFFGDVTHSEYMRECLQMAKQYNAENQICFHGITTNVPGELQKAALCVFPSKYEGFGLGLAEAMAAGIPAIGFARVPGVNGLIIDGENGFLVSDIDEMARKMALLMHADVLRERMGKKAAKSMLSYAPEIIWKKWDSLVEKTINKSGAFFRNLPVYLISYNRLSYLKILIDRLEKAGCKNIHIIDNGSSYPPLLEYLEKTQHTVHRMEKNYGHRVLFDAPEFQEVIQNEYFVLSDPDVVPVEECPADFIEVFFKTLQKYPKAEKVGFSLKIDDLPDNYELKETVIKWETPFYQKPVKNTSPVLYKAPIDTTFALYRPLKQVKKKSCCLRVGFPYTARHLPWYQINENDEETKFYNRLDNGCGNWNGTKSSADFKITAVKVICLFGRIPLIKIKTKDKYRRFYLFGFIPVLKSRKTSCVTETFIKIFGVTVLKIRKSERFVFYDLFGFIPVFSETRRL